MLPSLAHSTGRRLPINMEHLFDVEQDPPRLLPAAAEAGRRHRRMGSMGPSKRTRGGNGGGGGGGGSGGAVADRLSDLPDELLVSLISSLPMKEAVGTCVLSRRWRHVPGLLPVVDRLLVGTPFADFPVKRQYYSCATWDFEAVDRAIAAEPGLIRACEIVPEARPDSRVLTRWAAALACRGVRELVLDFRRHRGADASPVLFHCRSLTRLELHGCHLVPGLQTAYPPPGPLVVACVGLQELKLEDVELCDEMFLSITSACVRLERLELLGCHGFKWFVLGDAQSLRSLTFQFPSETQLDDVEVIDIDAPNLESLDLRVLPPPSGIRVDAPKVSSVHLCLPRVRRRCFNVVAPGLRKLLDGAPGMSCLQLRGAAVDCISFDRLPDSFHSPFLMLKKLYINVVLKYGRQAACLAVLLQQFTRLEQLNIFIIKGDAMGAGGDAPAPQFQEHQWRLEDAGCLRDHLKWVTISGFTGEVYETNLAGFILMGANVLKKLTLSLSSKCSKAGETAAQNLSTLKRASCRAKFLVKRTR